MASSRWRVRGVAEAQNPFNAKTIVWVVLAGIVAFAGFLVLTAYAPEMRSQGNGGGHAMSKSAIGFAGLYKLAEESGRPVDLARSKADWGRTGFMIVTIQPDSDPKLIAELRDTQRAVDDTSTVYVLPKWTTQPLSRNRKWVQATGTLESSDLKPILALFGSIQIGEVEKAGSVRGVPDEEMEGTVAPRPRKMHYIVGGLDPVLEDDEGHMVLGRRVHENGAADYVLADPDLLSNQGLKTLAGATAAMQIVDALRADDGDSVAFDMVLITGGDNRNLLRLMFEPPFRAFTLALLVAAILTGLHAMVRFGPPVTEGRAIPFGKRALADNAALLISRAGREDRLGDRYVSVVRDAAGSALGAHALAPDDLERWLGGLPGGFTDLAYAARNAPDATSMRDAAAALYQWKKDVTRDH
jgi:hypothetical protein